MHLIDSNNRPTGKGLNEMIERKVEDKNSTHIHSKTNSYDQKLYSGAKVSFVLFILIMAIGSSTDEELMGLQIGLALAFTVSSMYTAIGWLFRE